ncbi:MAG: peptide chain release factor N(5)-glutamine methyltransferase [Acidobacteria bacterium]|nr:peptide chain release factor N(5)-glutamine methyltransferase [Acidobacteriota bacterium]
MTISETLKRASESLRAASVPNDVLDAQTLLAEALGHDRTYLIINYNQQLPDDVAAKYHSLIERRATGEPLQYITGHQEFFGLEFEVNPDVLIPRPETEIIIEETIRIAQEAELNRPLIVDVGTGSGCIAVTLAREINHLSAVATDISTAALRVARRNAGRHGLITRINFIAANLLDAFPEKPFADFIISNPPYVSGDELPMLQREVREWEPRVALTDYSDGLNFYRRLLNDAPSRLKPGGYLLCEIGYTQSGAVTAMIDSAIWTEPRLLDDLQGIPRTIVLQMR